MKLVIGVAATASYTYALPALLRCIQANLHYAGCAREATVIFAGDGNAALYEARNEVESWRSSQCRVRVLDIPDGEVNYKTRAQQVVAQLRQSIVSDALAMDADYLWFIDSDVLPKANSLHCMLQMLQFDKGYYEVAFCTYPSQGQGGGLFLGGHGDPMNPIAPNIFHDELELTKEDKAKEKELRKSLFEAVKAADGEQIEKASKALSEWDASIRTVRMPKKNVLELSAKRWRRRGWFDFAYPAIGKGAVVPVDWIGFGNTLIGKRALSLTDWVGYNAAGTEDLYVIWSQWYPNNVRICCIPHCPADHVVRLTREQVQALGYKISDAQEDAEGKVILHVRSYHDNSEEYKGHLRTMTVPFFQHFPGEPLRPADEVYIHVPDTAAALPEQVDSPGEA